MLFLLESEVMTGVRCEASLPSHAPPLSPLVKHVSGPPVHLVPSPRVTKVIVVVQHHHLNKGLIMEITLSSIAISCIVLPIIFFWIIWPKIQLVQGFKDIQNHDYATKGLPLGPIFSKFNSSQMMNKKAFFANIEYSSLELATKKFIENNILEEGRVGHIYQSCFGVLAAVMILDGCGQDYDRMFDLLSLQILIRLCVQKSSERVEVS
ncbi:uncharacterized protein LOC110095545 isoform X1 [Dendrobium catenatum]|uniref:uncharacterized protein LOC110095545 isoform X1 n=1 Tax=Dendrobium catenatum TaxID=906689 RepID=UPI0010A0967B|nr:uncharacterized protein LOC110095545 isoform X1 [Dendrobium catenatum]XP_028555590.1 uncharacterized protein LOC110095545 isoform X1 [Dendrobium catenatum]XP_028555591.1 uncharacterized protein LOC110095545 isoform X1 [Dendrobium catenatum]